VTYTSLIYRYDEDEGYVFEDWDSNGNNIFGEWIGLKKVLIDLHPGISR